MVRDPPERARRRKPGRAVRRARSKSESRAHPTDSEAAAPDPGRFGRPIRNPGLRLPAAPAARPTGGRRGSARQPQRPRPGPGRSGIMIPGPGGLSGAVAGAGAGARLVYLGHGHGRHVLERATARGPTLRGPRRSPWPGPAGREWSGGAALAEAGLAGSEWRGQARRARAWFRPRTGYYYSAFVAFLRFLCNCAVAGTGVPRWLALLGGDSAITVRQRP